jgi:L-lactate dehydrogenase complex protein LldE
MKVAFFPGCMVDMFYPEVGIAAVNVLERLGCTVELPEKQVCCGQGLLNSGYRKETVPVAKMIVDAYETDRYDTIVSLTGSCMNAIVNDYPVVFADEPAYLDRTAKLAGRFFEFTDFIVNRLGVEDVGARFHETVTYHKSCHVTRLLGIKEPPLRLLEHVEGLQHVEMAHADRCCGFGGTFSFKEPEIAGEIVSEKCRTIIDTGANVVCGADVPCLMNIKGELSRMRTNGELDRDIRVMHIAQILDSRC